MNDVNATCLCVDGYRGEYCETDPPGQSVNLNKNPGIVTNSSRNTLRSGQPGNGNKYMV